MKTKKLLAVLCACALVFALAIPVFAAANPEDPINNPTNTDFEGKTPSATVSVQVLAGVKELYVNPYGLPYTLPNGTATAPTVPAPTGGAATTTTYTIKEETTTDGWFSTTAVIRNTGNTPLDVKVTMTTKEHGNVRVVAADPGAGASLAYNTLFGKFEITDATADDQNVITPDWSSTHKKTVDIPAGAGTGVDGEAGDTLAEEPTGYTIIGSKTDTVMGDLVTTHGYAAFRLRGSAKMANNDEATVGNVEQNKWLNKDVADVSVAFSFTPNTSYTP